MTYKAAKRRAWVVMLVGLALWGSLPLAIELNDMLANWSFISFELRNVVFLLAIALVFGIVSETGPFSVGRLEALEGSLFFGLLILVGLVVIYMRGWWFGFWTLIAPSLFFFAQISAFYLGRWVGRIPDRKMPNPAAEG